MSRRSDMRARIRDILLVDYSSSSDSSSSDDEDCSMNRAPRMVGDLPLKTESHFRQKFREENLYENNRYGVASRLERLQLKLHEESSKKDEVSLTLKLNKSYDSSGYSWTPYHTDIEKHWNAFVEGQKGSSLTSFKISNIQIPPAPFFKDKIVPILMRNTKITSLEFSRGTLNAKHVAKVVKFARNLVALDLSSNRVKGAKDDTSWQLKDAKLIFGVIQKHPSISYVNMSSCNLGKNLDVLSIVLNGCKNLGSLILDKNYIGTRDDIGSDGMDLINEFIKSHKTLTTLSLSDNTLSSNDVKTLAQTFENNDDLTLCELNLAANNLALGTKVESKLFYCDTLTHIDLSYNRIKMPGVKNIVSFLEKNPALSCLVSFSCFPLLSLINQQCITTSH